MELLNLQLTILGVDLGIDNGFNIATPRATTRGVFIWDHRSMVLCSNET